MNDVIYAFDADSNSVNGGVLWKVDLRNSSVSPIPITDIVPPDRNIVGNVGIESTPVIDPSSQTLYLVARTKEISSPNPYPARLHALDLTTGNEKFGGPVPVTASVLGLTLSTRYQNQRSSLALVNGQVLFSWASHEDLNVWKGWVLAYNATTLAQTGVFCSTPTSSVNGGGIWMSGRAPAVDGSGNVYYATGNGDWDGTSNYGDSVIQLSTANGTLSLTDYFTPDDYANLAANDLDLGSSGPLLIPGTSRVIHGGKTSIFYLMNTSNLGHEQSGNGQIVQSFSTTGSEIHSGPVFWNRTTGAGPTMYAWPSNIGLQAYEFNGSTFNTNPISQSTIVAPLGMSGGVLALSANGSTPGTGIVWSSMPFNEDGDWGTHQGVLRAFDADNLTTELWDSQMNAARDAMGLWPKYSAPVVANGKVYIGSFSNVLYVYGLLNGFTLSPAPISQSVNPGSSTSYTVSTSAVGGFTGSISFTASGLPAGASASFNPTSVAVGKSTTMTITTTTSAALGTYEVQVQANAASLTNSTAVSLVLQAAAAFSVEATPASQSINAGQNTSYTLTVTPIGGFSQSIALACSGAPGTVTCIPSPSFVTPNGASASQVQVNVTTAANAINLPHLVTPKRLTPATLFVLAVFLFALATILFVSHGCGRAQFQWGFITTVVLLAAVCFGCGGGGGSNSGRRAATGTPPGTYTLAVTATSGSASHTTTFTLVVQ